jgi:hypothetical protein
LLSLREKEIPIPTQTVGKTTDRHHYTCVTTCKIGIKLYIIYCTSQPLKVERATINYFLQILHQIVAFMLDLSGAILLILRDQVWQGIAGIATLISLFLAIRSHSSEKSMQAQIDQLKFLLRKGVIYHQTAPPKPQKQRQKAPLSTILEIMKASCALFYPIFPAFLLSGSRQTA